jgi:ABC-type Zn2+ transport system substrate-binding protein/surface adhesin
MPEDNSYAGKGSVMLDIGGDIGALVVSMPASMEGIEVEIRPLGAAEEHPYDITGRARLTDHDAHEHDHAHVHEQTHQHADDEAHEHSHNHSHDPARAWPHVAVVARTAPAGIVHSLVYAQLQEGSYELYVRPNEPVELTADVKGGYVTEVQWPT